MANAMIVRQAHYEAWRLGTESARIGSLPMLPQTFERWLMSRMQVERESIDGPHLLRAMNDVWMTYRNAAKSEEQLRAA